METLRLADFRIGPKEYEQTLLVLAREPLWARDRLRSVLAALLVAMAADRRAFDALFDTIFPPEIDPVHPFEGAPAVGPVRSRPQSGPTISGRINVPMPKRGPAATGPEVPAPGVMRQIWSKLFTDRLGWMILLLLPCGLIALGLYQASPASPFTPSAGEDNVLIPIAAWVFAALAAAGLLGPVLLTLRWLTRTEPVITLPPPPESELAVFRIGLVGGLRLRESIPNA